VLQIKNILNANKTALLLTTSLIVTGCNTVNPQNLGSNDTDPAPMASKSDDTKAGELSAKKLISIAEKAWIRGDPATALRLYMMANQKSPKDLAPLLGAAEILRKTKRMSAALDLYKKIIAKQPELIAAHTGIGYIYLAEDKPYLAAKSFEMAVSFDNNNAKSLGGLALALDTAGEHAKAQDYYRLAITSEPNNLTYQNNLALSLALIGRTEQAIAMFEIITAHPNATAQHRQNLALVYGMAGKSSDAMRYSRMDLNEKEARNNALYFQALNQPIAEEQITAQKQANIMVAQTNARQKTRSAQTSRQPYTHIEADDTTVALSTNPDALDSAVALNNNIEQSEILQQNIATSQPPQPLIEANLETVTLNSNKEAQQAPEIQIAKTIPKGTRSAETVRKPYNLAPVEPATVAKKVTPPVEKLAPAAAAAPITELSATLTQSHYVDAPLDVLAVVDITKVTPQQPAMSISYNTAIKDGYTASGDPALYYVQLASFKSPERAQKAWNILRKRHSDLLDQFDPIYSVADLGAQKGIHYRVRIGGFVGQATPYQICSALQDRSQDCYMPRAKKLTVVDDISRVIAETKIQKQRLIETEGQHTAYVSY